MPLPVTHRYQVSSKDVLSFIFDDPAYDVNQPLLIDPVDPSLYYSYTTARRTVQCLIAGFAAVGVQPGDTVCVHSFNSILYPLLCLGIIGAGGVSIGTNPGHTRHELRHSLKPANVKFVVAEPDILENMLPALQDCDIATKDHLLILDSRKGQRVPPGHASWRSLLSHGTKAWVRFDDEHKSRETVAQLYFTSGTSGLPKCAEISHQNLVAGHQLFYETNPRPYSFRIVLVLPFFHVGILPQALLSVIKQGRQAYVMRRFEVKEYLHHHARYQITETFTVPSIVVSIVQSGLADPQSSNYDPSCSMKSVRNASTGAAACSPEVLKRYQRLLADDATVSQSWGMTETTSAATRMPNGVARSNTHGMTDTWKSVGQIIPETEVKLIDEHGEDVSSTMAGELCVRGPSIAKRYFNNEKATRGSWDKEGFFKTGDVVEVTPETELIYIVGRRKELIKVRGFQVAPAELEGVLMGHPDVLDATVTRIKLSEHVEQPKAFVMRRAGSKVTEEEIKNYMGQRLARYKQLEGGIQFVDIIPRSPSGKVTSQTLEELERQSRTLQAKI